MKVFIARKIQQIDERFRSAEFNNWISHIEFHTLEEWKPVDWQFDGNHVKAIKLNTSSQDLSQIIVAKHYLMALYLFN